MIKVLLSAFVGLIVFVGCGGVSDINEKLSNGYVYIDESPQQKLVMFDSANSLKQQEKNYIPCKILKYKHNKKYIIAKIRFHYDMNCGTIGFKESKQLKEGKIYYYIIDTVKNIRYGAFESYDDFSKQLKRLNVGLKIDQ